MIAQTKSKRSQSVSIIPSDYLEIIFKVFYGGPVTKYEIINTIKLYHLFARGA